MHVRTSQLFLFLCCFICFFFVGFFFGLVSVYGMDCTDLFAAAAWCMSFECDLYIGSIERMYHVYVCAYALVRETIAAVLSHLCWLLLNSCCVAWQHDDCIDLFAAAALCVSFECDVYIGSIIGTHVSRLCAVCVCF
jgi:hypothetical protein